jgi:DNA-binding response OmpR family regulator
MPVIVLSAKSMSDEDRKRLMLNNVTFLTKPCEPQGLVEKISQMLS